MAEEVSRLRRLPLRRLSLGRAAGRRPARRAVGAVVLLAATMWALVPAGAQDPTDAEPVELRIYNAHEALNTTLMWANVLPTIPGAPQVSQISRGDAEGKRQLIEGRADAVVSGTPFSDAELADLDATGRGVIGAPVQGVGMSVFLSSPKPFGIDLCSEQQVPDADYTECLKVGDYTGTFDLRLTSEDVADVFLESGNNNWQNAGFLAQFKELEPVGQLSMISPLRPAAAVLRSDAGMANLALGRYIHTLQPAKWSQRAASLFLDPEPEPAAAWPFVGAPVKGTMPDAVGIVRQWKTASAATDVPAESGAMTMSTLLAALVAMKEEQDEPPTDAEGRENLKTELYLARLQNGAGEWVQLSPDSVTTALAAGGGAPLYGMTENVPGAWPLSWVNRLYVPDSGLTGDETNAIAALIRWQSTVGRQIAGSLGDGQLPDPMIAEALDAADQIVESNCDAAGLDTVVTTDPSRFAPTASLADLGGTATLADLGATEWCDTPVQGGSTPTTTVDSSGNPPLVVSSGGTNGSSSSGSSGVSPRGGATRALTPSSSGGSSGGEGTSGGSSSSDGSGELSATQLAAVKVARTMPMPMPDSNAPFDRLATLALGGALFLIGRGLLRRWGVISA